MNISLTEKKTSCQNSFNATRNAQQKLKWKYDTLKVRNDQPLIPLVSKLKWRPLKSTPRYTKWLALPRLTASVVPAYLMESNVALLCLSTSFWIGFSLWFLHLQYKTHPLKYHSLLTYLAYLFMYQFLDTSWLQRLRKGHCCWINLFGYWKIWAIPIYEPEGTVCVHSWSSTNFRASANFVRIIAM